MSRWKSGKSLLWDMRATGDCMFRSKADDTASKDAEHAISRIGAELGRLRVKRGERLEDIADYLGIKPICLYGIEQGDLSVIPSKRDVRSFTSSYANYMGLDGEAIMNRLSPIIQNLEGAKAPSGLFGFSDLDRTSATILAGGLLLGVVTGWWYLSDVAKLDLFATPVTANETDAASETGAVSGSDGDDVIVSEAATDDRDKAADPLAKEAEQALAALEDQAALEELNNEAGDVPVTDELGANGDVASSQAVNEQAGQAADATLPKEAVPSNVLATLVAKRGDGAEIYEPENIDARVIVRALDTSWIQVSSRDRSYLWTRTMQPREMLLVPNRGDLELWAGDASGVEILLDGVVLPTLGPPGTVVRGISLAPNSLEALSETVGREGTGKPTF